MGFPQCGNSPWHSHWLVPAGISLCSGIIALGGETARQWLQFDRIAVRSGEIWRLASGHFTHLGASHLALNLAGLFLVWGLVGSRFTPVQWVLVTVMAICGIDLGFWFLDTNLLWYVGLSGLLHSLLVAGALANLSKRRGESAIILVLVLGKLIYEQTSGPLPGSELTSGGSVVVNAHLYGSVAGLVGGLTFRH